MIGRTIIAGALLLLVACSQDDERAEPPVDFDPPATPDTVGAGLVLESDVALSRFEGVAPDTGMIGTARVLESEGDVRTLAIEVSGLRAGSFTWELRKASCYSDAAGDAAASGTLEVGEVGFGEASALLPDGELAGYSVVIRADAGAIVACAVL